MPAAGERVFLRSTGNLSTGGTATDLTDVVHPDNAEMHYIPHNVAETRRFFDAIEAPRFKWAFNVGHAHLVPDGFDGFLDGDARRDRLVSQ